MKNYKTPNTLSGNDLRHYVAAQDDFVKSLVSHCDYAITIQTNIKTFNLRPKQIDLSREMIAGEVARLRIRLNQYLTGHGWRRKNEYMPIFVTAIEGLYNQSDRQLTAHVHMALGNVKNKTIELIRAGVEGLWTHTDIGSSDICVRAISADSSCRWASYISKESHQGHWDCIDYLNTQAPDWVLNQ